jgi:glycosyltransferase involved in cell wall biosynthesis
MEFKGEPFTDVSGLTEGSGVAHNQSHARKTEQSQRPPSNTPLVSIACISYNQAKYIREAIDSLLMQETNFSYEMVIHDDASTDGTDHIIEEYASKYPHLMFPIYQKENQHSKGIRILATFVFPRCRGKYIAICEGDDYWTDPCKLQKQVAFLEANEEFSLCFTKVGICRNGTIDDEQYSKDYQRILEDRTDFTIEDILKDNFIHTCSVVFRRINLLNYPDWTRQLPLGDWPLYMINSLHGKLKYIDELTAVYRMHEGSVWSTKPSVERYKVQFDFYLLVSKYLDNKYDEIIIKSISDTAMNYIKHSSDLIAIKERLEKLAERLEEKVAELEKILPGYSPKLAPLVQCVARIRRVLHV